MKTSAEITPDHRKSSEASFALTRKIAAQTRVDVALCPDWWYFPAAFGNGGNRFSLPAPTSKNLVLS